MRNRRVSILQRHTRPLHAAVMALLFLLLIAAHASAQPSDPIPTTSGGTTSGTMRGLSSGHGNPGELSIEINIWGFVRSPGRYEVSPSARLLDVISAAGGPTERAKLDAVKVVHDKNIDSSHKELVVMIDLAAFQETGNPAANPVLYPGDTIIIPGDNLNTFNQVLSIVSNVAVVTLSVIGLIFAFKKN